jgi:parallel beta-helix repeat protein
MMIDNEYNFAVEGGGPQDFTNNIPPSNLVDNKPIYYWVNQQNLTVPSDAGYVALINCTNITVENLRLLHNGQGILVVNSTHSTCTQNVISNNEYGIHLISSANNTFTDNYITNNFWEGILLSRGSTNNIITGNNVTDTSYCGLQIDESWNNVIYWNNFINNNWHAGHYGAPMNTWDDGVRGNYWGDYQEKYPNASELNGFGFWDTPYVINVNNTDFYPLVAPWIAPEQVHPFWVQWWFWTIVIIVAVTPIVAIAIRRRTR